MQISMDSKTTNDVIIKIMTTGTAMNEREILPINLNSFSYFIKGLV